MCIQGITCSDAAVGIAVLPDHIMKSIGLNVCTNILVASDSFIRVRCRHGVCIEAWIARCNKEGWLL